MFVLHVNESHDYTFFKKVFFKRFNIFDPPIKSPIAVLL